MTFLVKAYRFGFVNEHNYIVYCGSDRDIAYDIAEEEAHERGGKYGMLILEYPEDGIDPIAVDYLSSSMGEDRLKHNWMHEKRQYLQSALEDYLTRRITDTQLRDKVASINGIMERVIEMEKKNGKPN
jgi:hypothetical protein